MSLDREAVRDDFHRYTLNALFLDQKLPACQPGSILVNLREAQLGVVVDNQLVAISRLVGTGKFPNAGRASVIQNFAQYHVLHFALEDTTAHLPGIDVPSISFIWLADDDTNHAVVAEDIRQADLQG